MNEIGYAVLVLGGIGLLFGIILTIAERLFHVEEDPRVEQVKEKLGGANCGACGFPGCDAFAAAVVKGETDPTRCAPAGETGVRAIGEIMGVAVETKAPMVARLICHGASGIAKDKYIYDGYAACRSAAGIAGGPKQCRFACIGLGDCMDVCKFDAITLKDGIVEIDETKCRACGACVTACPRGAIQLLPLDQKVIVRCRNSDVARVARNVCMDACIGCGRCAKECTANAIIVENGFARINPDKCTRCGACASVCPCNCIVIVGGNEEAVE